MDGKLFLYNNATPPPSTCFNFDLQRFATTEVTTASDLQSKINSATAGDTIKLADNFSGNLSATLTIDKNLTLDLNGKTLNTSANIGIKVASGKTFTVDDSSSNKNGSIVQNIYNNTSKVKDQRSSINAIKLEDEAGFTLNGGNITSKSVSIYANNKTNVTIGENAGTVKSENSIAVYFDNDSTATGQNTLTMNGGKLLSTGWLPTIQVSGSFVKESTLNTITINAGTVEFAKSEAAKKDSDSESPVNKPGDRGEGAIFASGQTALTIKDGVTVTSSHVGIEFRGGTLNVEGGTIESTNKNNKISYHETARGTSFDDGVAIAVSKSSKKNEKNITVNIEGGTIKGYTALAVANPCGITATTAINVTGGTLESTSDATADEASYLAAGADGNTATDKNGKSVDLYTLEGKNAIVNFDKQVTINLSGTTVKGSVAAMLTGRTSGTGYNIGKGNDFSNFTYNETAEEKLVSFYEVQSNSEENFTVTELGSNYGWNIKTGEENTWQYLVKGATADAPAQVATLTAADTTLTLTTGSGTVTLPVDMTATTFKDLSETLKTLDASAATENFALNAIANDNITAIFGGAGNDTLTAGVAGTSLNGGAGNDYLIGGDGKDNFIYTAGKDSIEGYTSSDVVSLGAEAGTAPIDFNKLSYDGNDFIVSLGSAEQVLTFINTPEFTIGNVNYKGNSNGVEHIEQGTGISLGAGYTSKTFDGSSLAYTTIDANAVTTAGGIKITGNDNASSLFGAKNGGELKGGYAGDSLKATGGSTTLNGDYGDDLLIGASGGKGSDLFVYSAGKDSIQNYAAGDLVSVKGLNPADAAYSVETAGDNTNISLDFGGDDLLVFENVIDSGVSLKGSGGKNIYTYTKYYYAINDKSVTLASTYNKTEEDSEIVSYDASKTNYETINAAAVNSAISVMGNTLNNKIFGSKAGGTLNGGNGDDTFDLSERTTTDDGVSYVFQYTAGKDVIDGFVEDNDQLAIDDATKITAAKASGDKLAFTFSSKSDVLTFKADNDIEKVSLNGGGYLTKDGNVNETEKSLTLFANAKGTIDLTDTPYKDTGINVVNATAAKNQSVTLVGGTQGGAFTFAENKKKDLFEYSGGNVTISNYEAGKDKINLENYSINGFKVDGDNVSLNVAYGENSKIMSIVGAAKSEVLIHDANSRNNSYAKTVFYANGVLHNKEKRPTIATISAGASGYQADNSIKKIFVTGGVSGIAITAGNNKTTLDASEGGGVSLYGGAKNDKLIGSTAKADTFIYSAGKDVIENYTAGEQISLTGSGLDIEDAKITLSKSSLKLKFSTKNTLTLKDSDLSTIKVDGTNYTFSKNAIGDGNGNVSLTSQFSGTYKIDAEDAGKIKTVYGDEVKKNITYKGTTEAETFTGGQKKTTFKGGGGDDTLKGGDGKDIFFYAKGETGNVTIQNFDTNDKLKIASGTISDISTVSGGVQFTMKKSKTDTAKAGTFKVETTTNPNEVLIKANNTYYWFADPTTAGKTDGVSVGDLITADTKVTKSQANTTGYAIIDLGYSTNLTKSTVAVKAGEFTFSEGSISKE